MENSAVTFHQAANQLCTWLESHDKQHGHAVSTCRVIVRDTEPAVTWPSAARRAVYFQETLAILNHHMKKFFRYPFAFRLWSELMITAKNEGIKV